MAEFIENKFWAVLPYDLVRDLQELMLSPAAVKEERDRKPRLLCGHSWPWPWGSVNDATVASLMLPQGQGQEWSHSRRGFQSLSSFTAAGESMSSWRSRTRS